MIEFLFLDLDDTILDFRKAEHRAVRQAISEAGIPATDAVCVRYSEINLRHWQMLERGEITREEVLVHRFTQLFEELGHPVDGEKIARRYEALLGQGHDYLPGAEQTVKQELYGKYRLFLASNGTARVQHSRLTDAALYPYFEQVFVSEELGANKPSREFFRAAFDRIPDFDPARAMMVGDSLTSDILGGLQAGIATCWVNLHGATPSGEIVPDHEIRSLTELPRLLKKL